MQIGAFFRKTCRSLFCNVELLLIFGLLFLASCATAPKTAPVNGGDFSALAPGGTAYFSIDVPRARPLLELISLGGFSGKDAAEFLDKTGSVTAAVYPPESGRSFLAAARGNYPSARLKFSFALNSAWKKRPSAAGASYWRSDRDGLSVSLNSRRALLSDGDPLITPPGMEPPPAFASLGREALLAGWTDEGAAPLNRFLALLEIPLQIPADRILFGIYPAPEEEYEALLRIETPSVSQARAVAALFAMARIFLGNAPLADGEGPLVLAAALFANAPSPDETAVIIRTGSLKAPELALLFSLLSVY